MSLWPAHAEAASAARTTPRRRPRNCSVFRQHRTSPSALSASVTSACACMLLMISKRQEQQRLGAPPHIAL